MQEIMGEYIALRMDDPGASSKEYEVYGKSFACFGRKRVPMPSCISNFLFLKKIPLWSGWASYPELTAHNWENILAILERFDAKMTVSVTACWVERDGSLIPYPEKFSDAASVLKQGVREGRVEIANHGLTHCVVGKHLPRAFSSNQRYHREFWEWLPDELHYRHIEASQRILQDFFEVPVVTLVPPGNVFSDATVRAARSVGIEVVNCNTKTMYRDGVLILGDERVCCLHDRDIALHTPAWLETVLGSIAGRRICQVRELAAVLRSSGAYV